MSTRPPLPRGCRSCSVRRRRARRSDSRRGQRPRNVLVAGVGEVAAVTGAPHSSSDRPSSRGRAAASRRAASRNARAGPTTRARVGDAKQTTISAPRARRRRSSRRRCRRGAHQRVSSRGWSRASRSMRGAPGRIRSSPDTTRCAVAAGPGRDRARRCSAPRRADWPRRSCRRSECRMREAAEHRPEHVGEERLEASGRIGRRAIWARAEGGDRPASRRRGRGPPASSSAWKTPSAASCGRRRNRRRRRRCGGVVSRGRRLRTGVSVPAAAT